MKLSVQAIALLLCFGCSQDQNIYTIYLAEEVPMHFVKVKNGSFIMGSDSTEQDRQGDEGPKHQVTISEEFMIGQFEVSQLQWETIMGNNPSLFYRFPNSQHYPVERVSWNEIQSFIAKLNTLQLGKFRLPTEAEWEYACRAGTTTRYSFGDAPHYLELNKYAWFNPGSEGKSHERGSKQPNPWGLYDMHGSVWEWCQDWYDKYEGDHLTDPTGPSIGENKIIRGGSWFNEPEALRSANRHRQPPDSKHTNNGFRLVMEIEN